MPLCWEHVFTVSVTVTQWRERFRDTNTVDRGGEFLSPIAPFEGWIYYVRSGGLIKIGHTTRLKQRIRAYPPDTVVLAVHRGSKADERDLHARFATYRHAGREWYDQGTALIRHINDVLEQWGPPPPEAHPQRVNTGRQFVAVRSRSGGRFARR